MKPKVIAIAGPTASGKTSLAIEIAKENNGEIVSADSRLVYKGFDIASAKPTIDERQGIVHHLIDIVLPTVTYSAGDYLRDAKNAIKNILDNGKMPIIAGGTGLYLRVLLENYNLPQIDTNYDLRNELEQLDKDELLNKIKILDDVSYKRLKDSNKRRIIRALEMIITLGKPLSCLQLEKEPEYDVEWIMPNIPSREWLYDRINKRVDLMFEQGIIEETKNLINQYGRISTIIDTIGYKEILMYIDGHLSLDEAVDKLKQHTRNYAKRQITWFRKNPAFEQKLKNL